MTTMTSWWRSLERSPRFLLSEEAGGRLRLYEPSIVTLSINGRAFSYYRRLGRVREHVLEHYARPISLKEAAAVAGMEETSFSKFFHVKTGVSFRDWLAHIRVERANVLIKQSNLPLTQIAHAVGFNNLRSLERAFVKHMGITPRNYKRFCRPS